MTQVRNEVAHYISVRRAHGPSWYYDGSRLAFVADLDGLDQAWLLPLPSSSEERGKPEQITHFGSRVGLVACSPVDQRVLVTSDDGGNEHDQLYLIETVGSEPIALTSSPDVIHFFGAWSPDGNRICYSSNQRHPAFFDIWVMDIATRETQCVFEQDASLMAVCWSPDGRSLIASRMNTLLDNDLFLVSLDGGEPYLLTYHEDEVAYEHPCFGPDGLLYVATNYGREFLALAVLDLSDPSEGHVPVRFLASTGWDVEALALSQDGTILAYSVNNEGASSLIFYDILSNVFSRVSDLPLGVASDLMWNVSGTHVAFSFEGTRYNGNIWMASFRERVALQVSYVLMSGIDISLLIEPELIYYPSFDGLEIPAYYYHPSESFRSADSGLPVIIFVHGGPEGQFRPVYAAPWVPPIQYYLRRGFAVFVPNVRGSTGYGKEFVHLDDVRLRPDSVADLKAAVEWLVTEGGADPARVGIIGRSYGGFMVLAALTTYPELWAAGVDIVGIANFVTFLENTGVWRRKWREAEYGSLEHDRAFLQEISPIHAVDCIVAPLFVIHGANDPRVPVNEAEQMVAALRERGVPVEYLRFGNEGHYMLHSETQQQMYPAIGDWFEQYMG